MIGTFIIISTFHLFYFQWRSESWDLVGTYPFAMPFKVHDKVVLILVVLPLHPGSGTFSVDTI